MSIRRVVSELRQHGLSRMGLVPRGLSAEISTVFIQLNTEVQNHSTVRITRMHLKVLETFKKFCDVI